MNNKTLFSQDKKFLELWKLYTAIISLKMKLGIEQSRLELRKHGGVLRKLLHVGQAV